MKKSNTLTPPEWYIMETLWDSEPKMLSEIIAGLDKKFDWSYTTYSTYMSHLVNKGVVGFRTRGRNKFYYARQTKEDCLKKESLSILNKIGKNNAQKLLVCMIKDVGLSPNSETRLEELIEILANENNEEK